LIVAAIVSIVIEMGTVKKAEKYRTAWIEGAAILAAVFICALVTAVNDWQKEK